MQKAYRGSTSFFFFFFLSVLAAALPSPSTVSDWAVHTVRRTGQTLSLRGSIVRISLQMSPRFTVCTQFSCSIRMELSSGNFQQISPPLAVLLRK